jgi:hypothetical protein
VASPATWRRVSDWNDTITLVDMADVDERFLSAHGVVRPEQRLRARFPRLADLAATTGFARVDATVASRLHAAGVPTYDVGYRRASGRLLIADQNKSGRAEHDLDVALASRLLDHGGDDDPARSDLVDALLRIYSEGLLTERAVIVADLAPPLAAGESRAEDGDGLEPFEALVATGLPDVSSDFVDRVASALAASESWPRAATQPPAVPTLRRAHRVKALVVGLVALVVALVGIRFAPVLAVVALPVVLLCGVIIVVQTVVPVLRRQPRQARRITGRRT